jgi:plasmid stabilization system protein ParE
VPTYRILLTPEAERQLSHEMRYSRRRWGKAHQQEFRRGLRTYIGQIAENPHVHRERPESFGVRVAQWKGLQVVYLLNEEALRMIIVAFVGRNRLIENALPDTVRTGDR